MADELTIGDAVRMARAAGLPDDTIREQFKANTGYDLTQLNPGWPLDRVRRMRQIDAARAPARGPKSGVQSFVEDVAVGVGGIPAMAAGAAAQTLGTLGVSYGVDPLNTESRNVAAANEARRVVAERSGQPLVANAEQDSADILSGAHSLLELGTGVATHAGKREPDMLKAIGAGIADRFSTGRELAAGAIGGTAGQYSAFAQDPQAAVAAQPVTWGLEALPLVGRVGAAAKALGRSQRAGRFAKVVETAGEAAAPGPAGRVDITPDRARPLTERAKADALELKKRVDEGVLTPEQAGAIMEKRFPGLVGPVSAAMTSAADEVAKGASALTGATAGAALGDMLPGGPLVGAAIGAVTPEIASRIKARIPAGVRASVARRFEDPNAQQTPEETVRAREILDTSRRGRGGIVAATERAGGRMEQGAELSQDAERVGVPAPGQVRVEVTPEGVVQPPRAESYARDAVSAMTGEKAAEVGLRQDIAREMQQSRAEILDPRNPEREQAIRDAEFLQERVNKSDLKYKAQKQKNQEVWGRAEEARKRQNRILMEKRAELSRAEAESGAATRAFRDKWAEMERQSTPQGTVLTPDPRRTVKASSPLHPLHKEWKEMVAARGAAKGLRTYVAKVQESRSQLPSTSEMKKALSAAENDATGINSNFVANARKWVFDQEIERRRLVAKRRLEEGWSPEIEQQFAAQRKLFENRLGEAVARGREGDISKWEQRLAWLNEDEQIRRQRPHQGLNDLRKKIRELDTLRPEARALENAIGAERRAVSGRKGDFDRMRPDQLGLKQEIANVLDPNRDKAKFTPDVPFRERALDEAAGLKTPTGTTSRVVRSSDPALERAVDDVHELVNQGGMKERFTRDEVGRWVTEPMNADSLTILRDAGLRGLVEARITKGLDGKAAAAVRAQLDDAIANLNRHALSDAPDTLLVRLPDGTEINTRDMAALVRSELSTTARGRAKVAMMMRSATRRVGMHLAMQAEQTSLARALEGEFLRTHSDQGIVQDSQIPTKESIKAVGRGEPLPMVMTVDPREAGARLAAHPEVAAAELGMLPQQIRQIAERMRDEYMPVPDGPVMDFMRAAEKRGDITLPTGRMFVTKGFYESLRNRIDGMEAFRQAADFHLKMGQAIKLGKTVYNPAAHLHNITSNLVYQSVRLGKNPLGVMREWTQTAQAWKDYLAGKPVQNERAMRSLGKTGFADTNALDDELSALTMRPAKSIPGVTGKAAASIKKGATVAQHVYKLGDNIPKLHEGLRSWTEIDGALQRMQPGRTIVLDVGKGQKVVLRKMADGRFETPNGKMLEYGDAKLDDIVAKAAIRPAIDIFLDYGDNPLYLSAMKRHGVGGMFSPFYSWFYGTMDRPGHKGLVSHMVDYAGGAPYWTDDAALSAEKAKQAVELAAKRTGYISATRNLLHEDRDELRQSFGFTPRGMHLMDMKAVPDSIDHYDVRSWESANPFAATDTLWRMGGSAIAQAVGALPVVKNQMFPDTDDGQPVTPEMKKLRYLWSKDRTGEWFNGEDALAVIGQSGGPLLDVMKAVDDARRKGQEIDPGKAGMLFLSLMVGGGGAALGDIAVGAADPASSMTSRRKIDVMSPDSDPEGAIVQYERIGDMMARKLLTLGSRTVSRGEAEKWRKRKLDAFYRSLTDALKKRSAELLMSSDGSESPEQLREQDAVWQSLFRMGEIAREIKLDQMERGFTVDDKPKGAP